MKAMLATHSDAAEYLLVTLDVGLHYYSPPVETPLSRAPWLYLARETETPFTPTVSLPIDARDTPQKEMSIQRSASPAARAEHSRCSWLVPDGARRRVHAVVRLPLATWSDASRAMG